MKYPNQDRENNESELEIWWSIIKNNLK
jgi:hypothetical protein